MQTKLTVEGMSCSHCAGAIKAELGEIDGIKQVDVSLENKEVIIEQEEQVDIAVIKRAIEGLGYEVISL